MAPKFIPFEEVEPLADILKLATNVLNLDPKRYGTQLRCECPVHGGGPKALCITPNKPSRGGSMGVFFCQADKTGGDRIGLVAHVMDFGGDTPQQDAAFYIAQHFGMEIAKGSTVTSTTLNSSQAHIAPSPSKKAATTRETTRAPFDPIKFGAELKYGPEVEALGYTEQEAADFGIGSHRGSVYKAARYASGVTAGYWKHIEGKWAAPKQWLPDTSNVVQLKRA